jgi:hypothetical protein
MDRFEEIKADWDKTRYVMGKDIRWLIEEVERLRTLNKKWADHDWECMQKLIKAEKAFEEIESRTNCLEAGEIATRALEDIR